MAMKGLILIAVIAIFVLLMSLPVVRPDLQQFTNMGSIEVSKTVRTWPAPQHFLQPRTISPFLFMMPGSSIHHRKTFCYQ